MKLFIHDDPFDQKPRVFIGQLFNEHAVLGNRLFFPFDVREKGDADPARVAEDVGRRVPPSLLVFDKCAVFGIDAERSAEPA